MATMMQRLGQVCNYIFVNKINGVVIYVFFSIYIFLSFFLSLFLSFTISDPN